MSDHRSLRFPADTAHLAAVRQFAAAAADDLGSTVSRADLALIVGELAANAVLHQTGDAELVLRSCDDGGLDVEVHDHDALLPHAHDSEPWDPEGHRGLHIVSVVSASWGVEAEPGGKRVWAHLAPVD